MLLRGHQRSQKIHQILISSPQTPAPAHYAPLPRRHSLTAKTKTRVKTALANKTISIKPDPHHSSDMPRLDMQNSSELLPNSSFTFYNNQPALSQFDNLQLQDFLKCVIVGENKVPEEKSQEIIRSLNGTWFKNTSSNQLPAAKLYNNLGIRRSKMAGKHRDSEQLIDKYSHGRHFMKEYTPPNIFPGKKVGNKRLFPSKSLLQDPSEKLKLSEESPLKLSILKRAIHSGHKNSNANIKRSQSQVQKKKSQLLPAKGGEPGAPEGLIKGTKMQLHKE